MTGHSPTKPGRIEPLPTREYGILRGLLLSRPACRWIQDMGIDFERLFGDRRARCLAVWAVSRDAGGAPADGPVHKAMTHAQPGHYSIAEWLACDLDPQGGDFKPDWGDADVQGFCRDLAPQWLGATLRDAATAAVAEGWEPDCITRDALKDAEAQNDHGASLLEAMATDPGIPSDIRDHLTKVRTFIQGGQ